MDGEFDHELDDSGWGIGKGWKSLGDQVELLDKATSTFGDTDRAQKVVQEEVRKLLARKGVGPWQQSSWRPNNPEIARVRSVKGKRKHLKCTKLKAEEHQEAEAAIKWTVWGVKCQGVMHWMKEKNNAGDLKEQSTVAEEKKLDQAPPASNP